MSTTYAAALRPGVPPKSGGPCGCTRVLRGWTQTGRSAGIAEHLQRYGPVPIDRFAGPAGASRLIAAVTRSGLAGRGGAWFPTGSKLAAVAAGRRRPVVVANGCEGDPASAKDHLLLTVAPHLVLDGAMLAAHAVRADEVIMCVHRGDPVARAVAAAIAARPADPVRVRVVEVPARYVASEASALVNFLDTGDARPTTRPPRLSERGVRGRPTLVDNVETLAHIALIARYGPEWFRQLGTRDTPGTALLTISGVVACPGVYELPVGVRLDAALVAAGGLTARPQAVLVGGCGGMWASLPGALGIRLSPASARAAGLGLGVATVVVLPEEACGLAETARLLAYLAEQSARQCGPCMFGLPAIADDLGRLAAGVLGDQAVARLRRRLEIIPGRGACTHPDGAVRLAASALRVFDRDLRAHRQGEPCRWAGSIGDGPR